MSRFEGMANELCSWGNLGTGGSGAAAEREGGQFRDDQPSRERSAADFDAPQQGGRTSLFLGLRLRLPLPLHTPRHSRALGIVPSAKRCSKFLAKPSSHPRQPERNALRPERSGRLLRLGLLRISGVRLVDRLSRPEGWSTSRSWNAVRLLLVILDASKGCSEGSALELGGIHASEKAPV